MSINKHFQEFKAQGSGIWWEEVNNYCSRSRKGGWNARMAVQLLPIHLVTYVLIPQYYNVILTNGFVQQIDGFILEQLGVKGYHEFYQYKNKQGHFHPLSPSWTHFSDDPVSFWEITVSSYFISSFLVNKYSHPGLQCLLIQRLTSSIPVRTQQLPNEPSPP